LHSLLTQRLYVGQIKHKTEIYAGQHDAIVDEHIFEQVQTQLRANSNNRGNRLPSKSGGLLKGLLRCPDCNVAMVHNVTRKKSLVYRYYTCIRAIKRGRASCKHPSLPAAEIESAVIQQIRCIAGDDGLRDEIVRQAAEAVCLQTAEFETQRHQLTRQLTREHEEVRRLATSNAYSTTTTARLAELHERIERSDTS